MRSLLTTIMAFFTFFLAVAQGDPAHYYFRNIRQQDGLSFTDVKAILQTSDGFMWFGTRNKLNRYDGRNFRIYDCYDKAKNFRNNNVSALFEQNDRHLWVGTDKGVFILDLDLELFSYIDSKADNGVSMEDWVQDIKRDATGNVWIIIPNQGVFRFDSASKLHHYKFGQGDNPDHGSASCIVVDRRNQVWLGTNGNGVYRYLADDDSFVHYLGNADGVSTLFGENIYVMCDMGNDLVIGVHEGKLRSLDKKRNVVTDMPTPQIHYSIIRDVKCFDEKLWVGTQSGAFVYDPLTRTTSHIESDPMCTFALSDNQIGKIYQDREGGIWIGTNLGGLNYLSPYTSNFSRFVPNSGNSISSKRVRELAQDANGRIWIVTEDAGIDIFDEYNGRFTHVGKDMGAPLSDNKGLSIKRVGDDIWVGYFKNGLDLIDSRTFNHRHISEADLNFNEGSIYAICQDSKNNIWLGNGWSVYCGDAKTLKFKRMPQFGFNYIFDIIEDSEHNIWVVTMGNGVYCYSPDTGNTSHFTHIEGDKTSIGSNSVNNVIETSRGELWFSTDRGGISKFNPSSQTFTTYGPEDGLPDDTSYKILEDKNGFLWFGTNNGLVRFNPIDGRNSVYTMGNGLPSNQFNYKAAFVSSSGRFYFGCSEGLTSFDPNNIEINDSVPPVFITKLLINNKEVLPAQENSPLKGRLNHINHITLSYDQNVVGFEFAVLSYVVPNANIYAYKMDKVNNDWIYTTDNNTMSYANLTPGKYTFHLKGANSDGTWNSQEVKMDITVRPPWWKSRFAIFIYVLLVIAVNAWLLYWYRKHLIDKEKEREHLLLREKENELYRYKLDLYVKIVHEIKTPVTLINGPLETLVDMNMADPEINRNLNTMRRSVKELINITNQLLDFRKIDSNNMEVHLTPINILDLLKDKINEFQPLAKQKGIVLEYQLPDNELTAIGDRNATIKIFNNLFSNALRYCDKYIKVIAGYENKKIRIVLLNDGETIDKEFQQKIFDPFYQMERNANVDSSTGIGLNIARSLAEMQNGSLSYSIDNGLNCFTLYLESQLSTNLGVKDSVVEDVDFEESIENTLDDEEPKEHTILVVEDNDELLDFLGNRLRPYFDVILAHNGREALDLLAENNISMIVSDVMMPDIDGFDLCRQVKSNIETSHLPVILLTAKNDLQSKIDGLRIGADAYIEKPFSFKYLYAQILSIFENRHRDKEAFNRNPFINQLNVGISNADKELMEKVRTAIEDNITNPNFGVEMLAELVCLSRSSLHRKIKAISGTSPTDFIRLMRLRKSTELISEGSYRIGEVCYLVGINSPSYFIKLFQKQFGMTPKEFENRSKKQNENLDTESD